MAAKAPSSPRKPRQAPVRIPGTPAPAGDNSAHREEEERVQLISFVAKLTQADIAIEAASAPLAAARGARKKIVSLASAAGFTATELKARMEEMNNPARDNPVKFAREERHRKWLGVIRPEQTEIQMGDKVPDEAKDEAHWRAEGFKAGLRQLSSTPPTQCPERFVQAFMQEHERGYLETATANAPKAPKPTVAEQAAADFERDNPDLDAAARKLKNDPAFMARTPEPSAYEAGGPDDPRYNFTTDDCGGCGQSPGFMHLGHCSMLPQAHAEPADGFEATPEELAAIKPRAAVVEAREADETPATTEEII